MTKMTEQQWHKQSGNHCFVCGPSNPIGLQVVFALEEDECVGHFTPGPDHVGWQNHTHGGIVFSLLDDVMANWLYLQGQYGVTARCEVRYRSPLFVGEAVTLRSRVTQQKRRAVMFAAEAVRDTDKVVIADCSATFLIQSGS